MNIKKIRKSVFETNSSSTHSICIAKEGDLIIPETLYFEFGEFGWEYDILDCLHEKASYLYTAMRNYGMEGEMARIISFLRDKGISVDYELPKYEAGSSYPKNCGYIDHGGELIDFMDDIASDNNKLMYFLFSGLSYIITGNDNSDHDVEINVDYPCDVYYKGN